jgi:hypothetical protein
MKKYKYNPIQFITITSTIFTFFGTLHFIATYQKYLALKNYGVVFTASYFFKSHFLYVITYLVPMGIVCGFIIYAFYIREGSSRYKKAKRESYKKEEIALYKRVEKTKQKAKKMRIPELLNTLYHEYIRYYPDWLNNVSAHQQVCSLVTEAVQIDRNKIKINLRGKDYLFYFKMENIHGPKDKFYCKGTMEISLGDKKVIKFNASAINQLNLTSWVTTDIESFVEGDWIDDFKNLQQQIDSETRNRDILYRRKRIDQLKNDFGLS